MAVPSPSLLVLLLEGSLLLFCRCSILFCCEDSCVTSTLTGGVVVVLDAEDTFPLLEVFVDATKRREEFERCFGIDVEVDVDVNVGFDKSVRPTGSDLLEKGPVKAKANAESWLVEQRPRRTVVSTTTAT